MPRRASDTSATRASTRLSREGIVAAAIELADRDGLAATSMRRLAQHLGVDAMSIYYHVRDKDALLAAMADAVVAQISYEEIKDYKWHEQLKGLIMAARQTMLSHPWAARVLEGRDQPTPAVLLHLERVLAIMRAGGCSVDLGHHAIHLLGSRILGFSQDLFDDDPDAAPPPEAMAAWAETMPHIVELATAVTHDGALGGCDDDGEFAFALDLLLEGLERRRVSGS
ncbi:TetR/AcrR family transcriptional regulator [Actinoplanes sp. KI2]|uniref:TetR/AcrR family transcriptional regulator n=1 Tax=Actinoplanes sp. KI2 TaxID=2983315 RepID=UPI0021D60CA9|nr:TetR/AcrR family transcriptional regulator [Actinoplanes sp. KI2]MCU7725502.1 TetR/AcrR family transcriptional regulator [Actinoplanes sp. KI2]